MSSNTENFKLISEIFEEARKKKTLEEQAAVLRENNSLPLRQLLKAALDPTVYFDVKIPEYRPSLDAPGCCSNNLYIESRRLYVFLKGSKVTEKRRTALLAQILESIDAADAELLLHIIRQDISKYGITRSMVETAFPGLL